MVPKEFPFFPARAPRRPPGYRWLVSRISSARGRETGATGVVMRGRLRRWKSFPVPLPSLVAAADEEEAGALDAMSRRARIAARLSRAAAGVARRLRERADGRVSRAGPLPSSAGRDEAARADGDGPLEPGRSAAKELSEGSGLQADSDASTAGLPWWQYGAVALVSFGLSLARPAIDSRRGGVASPPAGDGIDGIDAINAIDAVSAVDAVDATEPEPETRQADTTSSPEGVDGVPVAGGAGASAEATAGEAGTDGAGASRGASGIGALWQKAATTSRRAKLWLLLRRTSTAGAAPLLPGVEDAISTLPVPLASEGPPTSPDGVREQKEASVPGVGAAAVASAQNVTEDARNGVLTPQAVGGEAWNLFGFFPKDEEDSAGGSTKRPAISPLADAPATGTPADEDKGVVTWPMPVEIEDEDSKEEVRAPGWRPRASPPLDATAC